MLKGWKIDLNSDKYKNTNLDPIQFRKDVAENIEKNVTSKLLNDIERTENIIKRNKIKLKNLYALLNDLTK